MTLIESALRKMQEAAQAQQAPKRNARTAQPPAPARPVYTAAEPVPTEQIVRHQVATLDPVAMEQHLVLPQLSDDAALSAYKILRTRLLQKLTANHWYSIVVTGTQAQQGKTLTSINLSMALAQDPHTWVYLVDLDLRRPQIAHSLGMTFEHGLGHYLSGEVELDKIIYESGLPRLAIIPNSRPQQNSSEHLASQRMNDLLTRLSASSPRRIIVFDMPPLLLSDDVLSFAPNVDGVLLVATESNTTRASLQSAKELIGEMNILGVVLNGSSEHAESDYY
jgi:protein-tyrosine kinase